MNEGTGNTALSEGIWWGFGDGVVSAGLFGCHFDVDLVDKTQQIIKEE
jgi:hypothetical protein